MKHENFISIMAMTSDEKCFASTDLLFYSNSNDKDDETLPNAR